jgi:hypothetical protein
MQLMLLYVLIVVSVPAIALSVVFWTILENLPATLNQKKDLLQRLMKPIVLVVNFA